MFRNREQFVRVTAMVVVFLMVAAIIVGLFSQ